MNISFYGAAGMVTGSCSLLQIEGMNILVDCGMFQGEGTEGMNEQDFVFDPKDVDYVILTHAHIDHSGRLPKLQQKGFHGKVIATDPTIQLCELMLIDSARIQEYDYKKGRISEPLYTVDDAMNVLALFQSLGYRTTRVLSENVKVELYDAGHILGSAIVKFTVNENGKEKIIVFSGDLGHPGQKIVKDPEFLDEADIVLVESTYGNRTHLPRERSDQMLYEEVSRGFKNKGDVIIPSFAVERTQELLFDLNRYYENGEFRNYPVYFDTPLGISATKVYSEFENYYDEEAKTLVQIGDDPFEFPYLQVLDRYTNKSKRKELLRKPGIIIAGSGMCTGGRVIGHLKRRISDPKASILFIGYQAKETLGRQIQENTGSVFIDGQEYDVKAKVTTISGFSAHADQNDLVKWINAFEKDRLKKLFIVHGEESSSGNLQKLIESDLDADIYIPQMGESFNLS